MNNICICHSDRLKSSNSQFSSRLIVNTRSKVRIICSQQISYTLRWQWLRKDQIKMYNGSRTFQRSISLQPFDQESAEMNQRQNDGPLFPNNSIDHAVLPIQATVEAPVVFPSNIFNEIENEFRHMSRTELEIFAHTKILEANKYKFHFQEIDKQCTVLRSDLDKLKASLDAARKKYFTLQQHCDRFISEIHSPVDVSESELAAGNDSDTTHPAPR